MKYWIRLISFLSHEFENKKEIDCPWDGWRGQLAMP